MPPPTEESKALVRAYFSTLDEGVRTGDLVGLDALLAPDYLERDGGPEGKPGPAAEKEFLILLRAAFPDAHWDVQDMLAEDDRVAVRFIFRGTHRGEFLGIPPTGRSVAMWAMAIMRIAEGRLAETWLCRDRGSLIQQLSD